MTKLLFVSQDLGGTKMLIPIAKEAKSAGHEIVVVTGGKGAMLWLSAGMEPFFLGTSDFETVPFRLNSKALLDEVKPDAVIIEIPTFIHLVREIGMEANLRKIPVVIVEDYWSVKNRLPEVNASLLLTIDEYARKIAQSAVGLNTFVEIVGNHAVIDSKTYKLKESLVQLFSDVRKRFSEVFIYIGGKEVESELKILIPSLIMTPGNWGLICRYHPNWQNRIDDLTGKKFSEIWDALLMPIQHRIISFEEGLCDDLILLADACFSGFSASMGTAVAGGKPTVAIRTAENMLMLKEVYLDDIPVVVLGGASVIEKSQNLRPLLIPPSLDIRKKFLPPNPSLALKMIESKVLNLK